MVATAAEIAQYKGFSAPLVENSLPNGFKNASTPATRPAATDATISLTDILSASSSQ